MTTDENNGPDSKIRRVLILLKDIAAPALVAIISTATIIVTFHRTQAVAQRPLAAASQIESNRSAKLSAMRATSPARTPVSTNSQPAPSKSTSSPATSASVVVPEPMQTINSVQLVNQQGQPVQPGAVVLAGNDLYFLTPSSLLVAINACGIPGTTKQLVLQSLGPAKPLIGTTPMQEFSNLCHCPEKNAIEILDKSGDLFEFDLKTKSWRVLRPNSPLGSPDPEYIDMAVSGKNVLLLDPERNQIWRYPATSARYFKEVMPWRLRAGDVNVADGIAIAFDGDTWVLRKTGTIAKFNACTEHGMARQMPFHWVAPKRFRPSRLYTAPGLQLFIVERENNRVLTVDKSGSTVNQYLFPATSNLRGIVPLQDRFYAIDGSNLVTRFLSSSNPLNCTPNGRLIDARLAGLTMPIKNATLPRHAGVWPGARRLYRYGIHKGTDFFSDAGPITMGTPVLSADAGKVIRCDADFRDMNAARYSRVMYECHHRHITSESNEDLLRGCQVWIDHGGGLVTKYAHLDRIMPGLKTGAVLSRGEQVGYVGVSGTGENLPGRGKHPHLHFEIWLDNRYVGYGLTPAETIGVLEDIFGAIPRVKIARGARKA